MGKDRETTIVFIQEGGEYRGSAFLSTTTRVVDEKGDPLTEVTHQRMLSVPGLEGQKVVEKAPEEPLLVAPDGSQLLPRRSGLPMDPIEDDYCEGEPFEEAYGAIRRKNDERLTLKAPQYAVRNDSERDG